MSKCFGIAFWQSERSFAADGGAGRRLQELASGRALLGIMLAILRDLRRLR